MATKKAEPEPEFEWVDIDSVDPAEYNPRTISPAHLRNLKQGLAQIGWASPITVNIRSTEKGWPESEEGHRVIVAGHQRIRAAKELGMPKVPVMWVRYDEALEKATNIALNNPELEGEWTGVSIAKVLKSIEEMDPSMLSATGLAERQIKQFMKSLATPPLAPVYPLTPRLLEHYDFVVVFTENETDWMNLQSILKLEKNQSYKKDSKAGLGLGRVISFEEFEKLWNDR